MKKKNDEVQTFNFHTSLKFYLNVRDIRFNNSSSDAEEKHSFHLHRT